MTSNMHSIKRQARREAWYSDSWNPFRKTSRSKTWAPNTPNGEEERGETLVDRESSNVQSRLEKELFAKSNPNIEGGEVDASTPRQPPHIVKDGDLEVDSIKNVDSGYSFLGGISTTSSVNIQDVDNALSPDRGTEADFEEEANKFGFSPGHLSKLLNPKSLAALFALGGLSGLERGLRTDIHAGLSVDEGELEGSVSFQDVTKSQYYKGESSPTTSASTGGQPGSFSDRIRIFKANVIPTKKATPLWKLMWRAYNDKVLLLLTGAAVISLALGLYETFRDHPIPSDPVEAAKQAGESETKVDWVEGVAIVVAILIVVIVGSLNDWQKERAFVKLNAKKDDREVKVVRSGKSFVINVYDILVGDVLHLEPGDMIPTDGIFITGHNVKCDESSATGESDSLKKTGGAQVSRLLEEGHTNHKDLDPFIISGAKLGGVVSFGDVTRYNNLRDSEGKSSPSSAGAKSGGGMFQVDGRVTVGYGEAERQASPQFCSESQEQKARNKFLGRFGKRGRHDGPTRAVDDDTPKKRPCYKGKVLQHREPFTLTNQIKHTLFGSWVNILLLAAPVGIALNYAEVDKRAVSVANFIAIIRLTVQTQTHRRSGAQMPSFLNALGGLLSGCLVMGASAAPLPATEATGNVAGFWDSLLTKLERVALDCAAPVILVVFSFLVCVFCWCKRSRWTIMAFWAVAGAIYTLNQKDTKVMVTPADPEDHPELLFGVCICWLIFTGTAFLQARDELTFGKIYTVLTVLIGFFIEIIIHNSPPVSSIWEQFTGRSPTIDITFPPSIIVSFTLLEVYEYIRNKLYQPDETLPRPNGRELPPGGSQHRVSGQSTGAAGNSTGTDVRPNS